MPSLFLRLSSLTEVPTKEAKIVVKGRGVEGGGGSSDVATERKEVSLHFGAADEPNPRSGWWPFESVYCTIAFHLRLFCHSL